MKKLLTIIKHVIGSLGLVVGIFIAMPVILLGGFVIIAIVSDNNWPSYLAILLPAIFVALSFGLIVLIFLRKHVKLSTLLKGNKVMSMGFVALLCIGSLATYYYIKSKGLNMFDSSGTSFNTTFIPPTPSITAEEIIKLTNDERVKLSLKPLTVNDMLTKSSALKAQDMIDNNYWAHVSPTKVEPWFWIKKAGYDYIYSGENLAKDYSSSNAIISAWMISPEHKENIINPQYKEIGVTVMKGKILGTETTLVVQHFGSQRSNTPPNYSKETISSWETSLADLQKTLPSWENTRNSPNLYPNNKEKCERMITILQTRVSKIQQVVTQMKANKWLSTELDKYTVSGDTALYNEQLQLASYLNNQKW